MIRKKCSACGAVKVACDDPAKSEFLRVARKPADEPQGYRQPCRRCRNALDRARYAEATGKKSDTAESLGWTVPPAPRWASLSAFDAEQAVLDSVSAAARVEQLDAVQEHRLRARVRELEADRKCMVAELSDARAFAEVARDADAYLKDVPPIEPRERQPGILREATAFVMASDWHIEEEVRPEQVEGRNRYNLQISARRMERFFQATRWAIEFHRQAFTIRDLLLWFGGDFITNFLHEDNVITNLLTPPEALAYARVSLGQGVRFLLGDDRLERIVIPCNDGNHGRGTKRMASAARTAMSFETMLYRMLAQDFAGEPRVQFLVAEGSHLYYQVYGRTIRFLHGDQVRYQGGVGGLTIPLIKAVNSWQTFKHADLTCLGHWHQRLCLPDIMVNGSLIGYNSFALDIKARFEQPSQNFSILEPQRFRADDMPLWVADISDDVTMQGVD